MASQDRHNVTLFIAAQLMTVFFITLLQMSPLWLFIPFLLLMHVGIALFVISKKRFLQETRDVKPYYTTVYRLLALYLPVLAYKLPARWLPYEANTDLIVAVTLSITVLVVVVCAINTLKLVRMLRAENKG